MTIMICGSLAAFCQLLATLALCLGEMRVEACQGDGEHPQACTIAEMKSSWVTFGHKESQATPMGTISIEYTNNGGATFAFLASISAFSLLLAGIRRGQQGNRGSKNGYNSAFTCVVIALVCNLFYCTTHRPSPQPSPPRPKLSPLRASRRVLLVHLHADEGFPIHGHAAVPLLGRRAKPGRVRAHQHIGVEH